jgi:hypothetical protein
MLYKLPAAYMTMMLSSGAADHMKGRPKLAPVLRYTESNTCAALIRNRVANQFSPIQNPLQSQPELI